jgi:hypothetical protein
MKQLYYLCICLSLAILLAPASLRAEDVDAVHKAYDNGGFGAYFSNEAPAALAEKNPAESLSEIEPASGMVANEGMVEEKQAESELEKVYNTDINRTVIERDNGSQAAQDTIGDGNVGIFYDHSYDERLGDESDAIGVKLKIMEFE